MPTTLSSAVAVAWACLSALSGVVGRPPPERVTTVLGTQAWGRQLLWFSLPSPWVPPPPDDGALPLCQALAAAACSLTCHLFKLSPCSQPGLSLGLSAKPELPYPVSTCTGRRTSQTEEHGVQVAAF